MKSKPLLAGIGILYFALVLPLGRYFPPVNSDEVVRAVIAEERMHGQTARYSLYDDIFARPVYAMRDVLPEVSLTLYHDYLGAWLLLQNSSYRVARLSSAVAGVLALVMLYALGRRLGGTSVGIACAILGCFNPVFLTASLIARPEVLLVFTSAALLWLTIVLPEAMALKPFLLGGLGALQLAIHPNAAVIDLGLLTFYLYPLRGRDRSMKALSWGAGAFGGLLGVLVMADITRLWLGLHTVHSFLLRPPIFSWPWHPLRWIYQTLQVFWNGQTFYFDPNLAPGWPLCVRLGWIALALLGFLGALEPHTKNEDFNLRRLGISLGVTFLGSVAFVKAKECLYGTNFWPFAIPLAAAIFARSCSGPWRVLKYLGCALAGASLCLFLSFSLSYAAKVKSYSQIVHELRAMLPKETLKVAGPSVLWFAWDKNNFRDSGALIVSRWYMGGSRDIQTWLDPWRPDILILDPAMQPLFKPVQKLIKHPVELLGVLDTKGAYGSWEIYRIHWTLLTKSGIPS